MALWSAIRRGVGSAAGTVARADRWLLGAIAAGVFFGAQGWNWGRYDCLNLDRMAFKSVMSSNRGVFEPASFRKPPFYTYVNFFLARWPAEFVGRNLFWTSIEFRKEFRLIARTVLARGVNLAMFAALVAFVYQVANTAYGLLPARVSAWILATSAGFVPYQIYLTTDLAMVFLMGAVFVCAVGILKRPGIGISVAAGLLAGLCAATKYNGLAIAICLPLAHLLASGRNPVLECLRRPAAWLCGLAVPVGFVLGNPYSVLNFPKFRDDFLYNYTTTPVYGGQVEGTGYVAFLFEFFEIFGQPAVWFLLAGLVVGFWAVIQAMRAGHGITWKVWLLAAAVFILYFWKIGEFPRMTTRFVLPMAPFVLLLAAAGFGMLFRLRWVAGPVLVLILAYNAVCAWMVGGLFRNDPRMLALRWADENMTGVVESSTSSPQWNEIQKRKIKVVEIPSGVERRLLFEEMFAADESMLAEVNRFEDGTSVDWFTAEARRKRNPRFVAWNSMDVESLVRHEYDALSQPDSGYRVVFDASSPERPGWAYPKSADFLINRMTIWERING